MEGAYPPEKCPLCGQGNDCGMVAGSQTCWCAEVSITPEVIGRIPEAAQGAACICRGCARGPGPGEP